MIYWFLDAMSLTQCAAIARRYGSLDRFEMWESTRRPGSDWPRGNAVIAPTRMRSLEVLDVLRELHVIDLDSSLPRWVSIDDGETIFTEPALSDYSEDGRCRCGCGAGSEQPALVGVP